MDTSNADPEHNFGEYRGFAPVLDEWILPSHGNSCMSIKIIFRVHFSFFTTSVLLMLFISIFFSPYLLSNSFIV